MTLGLPLKVLILKPSSLGDVVHALPVARMLKRHLPSSEIFWWIDAGLAPLLQSDPDLTGVVEFQRQRWRSPLRWMEALRSLWSIRSHRFDLAIDLQALARSAVVAWLSGARRVIGLGDPREGAPTFHDSSIPRPSYNTHAVDWYLEVLRLTGTPLRWDFEWLPRSDSVRTSIHRRWQVEDSPWILLQPGARWPNKRWPEENFRDLITALGQKYPRVRFGILGSAAESTLGQSLAAAVPGRCLDLTGKTSLPEMIEWIRAAKLLISNDSGPMHIAAAVGTPVAAVFGPTEPSRTGPYRQWEGVLQKSLECVPCMSSRCHHPQPLACMKAVTPQEVLNLACLLLKKVQGNDDQRMLCSL